MTLKGNAVKLPVFSLPLALRRRGDNWQLQSAHECWARLRFHTGGSRVSPGQTLLPLSKLIGELEPKWAVSPKRVPRTEMGCVPQTLPPKLTDSFLKNLSTATIGGIDLGDGNFTEAGLKNLGTMENRKLSLTGKQFAGKCFEDWSPICIALSMRGSSINDDTLAYVAMLTRVSALDLSNTAITDSGLASPSVRSFLSKLFELNLSDTRVTAKGLMD